MEAPDYKLDDFLKHMDPSQWMEPRIRDDFWVFWSQEEGGDLGFVTETLANNNWGNVKSELCNAKITEDFNVVIQIWVPTTTTKSTTGGCCVLTTSNQPFVLYRIERGVCEYRKHCTSLKFNVFQDEEEEEEDEVEFGGPIGRVFRDKNAESTTTGGPLVDFAHKCGIRISYFLPLFKPSSRCCSGVLEISYASKSFYSSHAFKNDYDYPYLLAAKIFKDAKFFFRPPALQESTEIEEINKALQVVCTTHQLPLTQIWIPCCTSTAMASVDSPGKCCHSPYLSCSNKYSSSISHNGDADVYHKMQVFNHKSKSYNFRKGKGIVGKALLYHKPCFWRAVTQLPKAEYPLSDDAGRFGLSGCCAIWLHSTCTKNLDYVLELFLPRLSTISGDLRRYFELLLATVKKQFPTFKISSVGEESYVEVSEISVKDDEPDSVIISQTFSVKLVPESFANEKETVQNKVVGETVIDNGSNILGLEQNGIVACHSEKTAVEELFVEAATNDEITMRLPPTPESLLNENEVVQQLPDDEPTMDEAVRKNELDAQTSVAVTSSERIFSRAEASDREYRTANIAISREDLTKHFGKLLDDAARELKVSRSTMKRALRQHNIARWPAPKRKKINALCVRSGNEGIEGTYKGDHKTSISHKKSNSRQEQDVGTVAIKAMKINALHVRSGNEGIEGTYKGYPSRPRKKRQKRDPSCSDPPPTPAAAGISHKTSNSRQEQDVGTVTVKVTHGGDTFRFDLPTLSTEMDLVEKLTTRMRLNEGSFHIKYQDEENDWISIACDEDLEQCIGIWKGKSKIIRMLVQPITNQAP